MPAIINTKFTAAKHFAVSACEYCMFARAKKRLDNTKKVNPLAENEGELQCDKIEVGDFVSTDQLFCSIPGRLRTGYGRDSRDSNYRGGTIYNAAASNFIWVENKVYLGSNETVMGKSWFQQWIRNQDSAEVSHYHGYNGITTATQY